MSNQHGHVSQMDRSNGQLNDKTVELLSTIISYVVHEKIDILIQSMIED